MSVFISWSGTRSAMIGDAFRLLLTNVFPGMEEPFLSVGISGGADWRETLERSLDRCDAIIFCFTPEATTSGWVLYEAGYMAARDKPIFPFVYGAEVPDPLRHLQAVAISRETVGDLIVGLHERHDPTTSEKTIEERTALFDHHWPIFDEAIRSLVLLKVDEFIPPARFSELFNRKTFIEPFPECVDNLWLERYEAVARTKQSLDNEPTRKALSTDAYVTGAFRELNQQLDRYQMLIGGTLLRPVAWDEVHQPDQRRLEMCRQDILRLVRDFNKPSHWPLLEESIAFAAADTGARKDTIHAFEIRLENDEMNLKILARGTDSGWELDRIVTYVAWQKEKVSASLRKRVLAIRREEETARTRGLARGLQPLYYALEAFDELFPLKDEVRHHDLARFGPDILETIRAVGQFIEERDDRDTGGHIRRRIDSIGTKIRASELASELNVGGGGVA